MRERRTRVHGPYKHRNKFRIVIVSAGDENRRSIESFDTEAEAEEGKEIALRKIEGRTVSAAVREYKDHLDARVTGKEISQAHADREHYHLRRILQLARQGGRELRLLTPSWAETLYAESRKGPVDTQRNGLGAAKAFGGWCVSMGWLKVNPFGAIKGKGRRKHGKPQLSIDETRTLRDKCHELALVDDGAILVLGYILLGARAGELTKRRVRDVDDNGRLLRMTETKTREDRWVKLPAELVPLFERLTHKRKRDAFLFARADSRARDRDWALDQVKRLCKLAGVIVVTAQGLRGGQASIAAEAGATPDLVAATLGNSPAVAQRAYIKRGAVQAATTDRVLSVLTGGKL